MSRDIAYEERAKLADKIMNVIDEDASIRMILDSLDMVRGVFEKILLKGYDGHRCDTCNEPMVGEAVTAEEVN
jgi:hypothetical protein